MKRVLRIKKYLLQVCILALFFLYTTSIFAQSVGLYFSSHPNADLVLYLKQGTDKETIFSGKLDNKGQAEIRIPAVYKNHAGMATALIGTEGAQMDFILNGENMRMSCTEEHPHGGNVVFENSAENESLQRWFMGQSVLQQKLENLFYLQGLYKKEDSFYKSLENEKKSLESQLSAIENEIEKSGLYAAGFMRLHKFLANDIAPLVFADSARMAKTRSYITDTLDLQALYTSGLWFDVLNGSLALYDMQSPYHNEFVKDMAKLLSRADDKVYTGLAENLFAICESTGWNDLEEELAYFLINDGRIKEPTGKLKMLMTLFKLSKNSPAPELSQGKLSTGKTILVFYESGCGPCENEMQQLKGNYPLLKEKGYEVVSVSADTDEAVFRNTSESFPWEEKYCDLQGFKSPDFINYGVIGTPTFYVIDKTGIVQGRYSRLDDTEILR